jgi:hypothetical protein
MNGWNDKREPSFVFRRPRQKNRGGAQVRTGRIVEAMFAIHGDQLYVTSRTRGTFVQPLRHYVDFYAPVIVSEDT